MLEIKKQFSIVLLIMFVFGIIPSSVLDVFAQGIEALVEPTLVYDKVYLFKEGLAKVVNKDQKYGFVDKKGKEVVQAIYDEAGNFNEGLASVRKGTGKR